MQNHGQPTNPHPINPWQTPTHVEGSDSGVSQQEQTAGHKQTATTRILANAATFYWQGTYETVI